MYADEMFKMLGYKKQDEEDCIMYYLPGAGGVTYFEFDKKYKKSRKIIDTGYGGYSSDINMQELQAKNEKEKELGWLGDDK